VADDTPEQVIREIEHLGELRMDALLHRMGKLNASDLYLIHGRPPEFRVAGRLVSDDGPPLNGTVILQLADQMMTERHRQEFKDHQRADIAYAVPKVGRFRVNVYLQRGSPAVVIRRVNTEVPSFADLGLPPVVAELALGSRGLVLVTGQTGSGKSTTLAAMIRYRSRERSGHIVTIEDPIEFAHPHAESIISQREVGTDTESFHMTLRDALRQAPDVILIGEIRDEESATAAVHFAETGHLVLSTLHSTNASQTLERLLHFFPSGQHEGTAMQLSMNLNAIISQRLIRRSDGQGRVPAIEIMLSTPRVRELLRKNDLSAIRSVMQTPSGIQEGMQTFDYALYRLIQDGLIDVDTAMVAADSANELRMRLKGLV
jgi:twitching motility protein PilU